MFEVNATRKTFAGHKFYSETVLGEFCVAVLISSILYLKYPYWGERLLPDGRSCTERALRGKEVNVTFLKKCNDEQNNASWYQTFVIVQTDWFKQKIYVFLDCVFGLTRDELQANFQQQVLNAFLGMKICMRCIWMWLYIWNHFTCIIFTYSLSKSTVPQRQANFNLLISICRCPTIRL